jgi:hypothetical protein
MKYRKLRITWSITWGLMAVLLCVLWVRSYWWVDTIQISCGSYRTLHIVSIPSRLGFLLLTMQSDRYSFYHQGVDDWRTVRARAEPLPELPSQLIGGWINYRGTRGVLIPFWLLAATGAAVAFVPWIPHRFSVRTLLIAITLVAIGLGLIVWLCKAG